MEDYGSADGNLKIRLKYTRQRVIIVKLLASRFASERKTCKIRDNIPSQIVDTVKEGWKVKRKRKYPIHK